ncbi:major facilitator superfamily transporter [Niveomyces insectorum RCEF 264]|uniref:Major facilitator superfamily transporter n=1 Tax=Niveomyces insectorum RCEF 264 TaxID=1081102 RepID=A0A168A395_9HYPO|nr:major facilitator superfamily transporter [Niveomyces insectorum RCEF 264]
MAKEKRKGPKLPVQQLAILAFVRFAEPVALTSVFPYLPEMIQSFGVPKDEVAKWAGLTSAVFSVAQSVTAVPWGWASDTIGRKPTIIFGLLTTMVCFIFWGASTSLYMAIAVRAIHGGSNGNVGTIRTMVAEMVPERILQPRAFSIMPMVWSVGSVFGPSFGGFFARPAEQHPGLFGKIELLKKFPFLLPNLIACIFFLCSVIVAVLFLEETLETRRYKTDWGLALGERLTRLFRGGKPSKRSQRRALARAREERRAEDRNRRRSFVDDEASAPLLSAASLSQASLSLGDPRPPTSADAADHLAKDAAAAVAVPSPTRRRSHASISPSSAHKSIFTYQTTMALVAYALLALHSVAYDQVLPVFLNYPRQSANDSNTKLPFKFSGGFGLSSGQIGTIFTCNALVSGFAQFVAFPPLCTRFGALRCFRWASFILPFVYFATPYTILFHNERVQYAAFMFTFIAKGCLSIVTFPCVTIILTNSAPSVKVLGTLNGFATTVSGVGRAAGPAMTGAAFTWGVRHGYVVTGWFFLAIVAVIGAISTLFLDEAQTFGNSNAANEPGAGGEEELAEDGELGDDAYTESGSTMNETDYDDYDDDDDGAYEESVLRAVEEDDEEAQINNVSSRPHTGLRTRAHSRAHSLTHSRTSSRHWAAEAPPLPAPSTCLFPANGTNNSSDPITAAALSEPLSPAQERHRGPQLPKLQPPSATPQQPLDLREPDDPDPVDADSDGVVGLGLGPDTSAPSSPVRTRRNRGDSVAGANAVPLSPVVSSTGFDGGNVTVHARK